MYVTIDVYCAHLIEQYNGRHVLGIYRVRNSCDKCVRRANNCYRKIQIIKLYTLEQNIIHYGVQVNRLTLFRAQR